jgi:hypothetical protein
MIDQYPAKKECIEQYKNKKAQKEFWQSYFFKFQYFQKGDQTNSKAWQEWKIIQD